MPIEDLIASPITGIRPFNELPIDAEIWREAHEQHALHRRLHNIASHRPGIVYGLEVVVSQTKERTVVVAPGVAVDSDGNAVVLGDPPVAFTLEEKGQTYITLSFLRATDRKSAITVGTGQQHYRIVEGRDVRATKEPPSGPYIELARIWRTGPDKPVKEAANPFDPGNDELNLLNRPIAFPHCYAEGSVGELSYVPATNPSAWKPNRAGLWHLVREGNGRGFHLSFTGPMNLRQPSGGDPILLYVAGAEGFQPLSDAEINGLKEYLGRGGMLLGEASKGSEAFAKSFEELAGKLGAKLKKVDKGHPLLTAHHVFSSAPPGSQEKGTVTCDEEAGVLFTTYDYGGAWQGDIAKPEALDARERIRQAQEFGLNILAYSAHRLRTRELRKLG
ncbi:MAG: DUF4159 domain-containing protein [Chthonomonadales bacterium]|nr:DUF4159 domain-containing protein [Chthonomonadales bacterium]